MPRVQHPELAGVYAEQYMTTTQQMNKHYRELRVFRDVARMYSIVGAIHIEPPTTFRELRELLQVRAHAYILNHHDTGDDFVGGAWLPLRYWGGAGALPHCVSRRAAL